MQEIIVLIILNKNYKIMLYNPYNHANLTNEHCSENETDFPGRIISTNHVSLDRLTLRVTIAIPEQIRNMIYEEKRKIKYIEECRNSRDPRKKRIFSNHTTIEVLDIDKFYDQLENLKSVYVFEMMTQEIAERMECDVKQIFNNFINRVYVKYV